MELEKTPIWDQMVREFGDPTAPLFYIVREETDVVG